MKMVKGLVMCIQFFTSIPIPYEVPMDRIHINKAVKMFPVLGVLQGILYSAFLYVLLQWTPLSPLAIAFFVWLALIIITGGIHLDGWMDCSDAYFSYRDQQKRIEIMADPKIGAFGVLSVIVLLSAKFLFIYEIVLRFNDNTFLLIILIPFLGKVVMGMLLLNIKSAKEEGLGSLFKEAASQGSLWIYPVYVVMLGLIIFLIGLKAMSGFLLLVLAALVFFIVISRKIVRWFGGITGDVLGASVEGVECLLWMTVWLWHYFVTG
ncbi:adenosylcobinamide-GDP ribazoletransferase [Niallia sp. XMNu-256]|uniref:adenosylcobinamide-GDP ribazoletransferase n=1 Tax=Niallia sp. XMNu-256 TaxID=3082444 RepID=UPI0030D0500C